MSESCVKARACSNPHFLGYRHFVMATRVAFTHAEALFPGVPAGDSLLFNVPANIEIFTGVLCFTDVSLFILRSRSRPPRQPKFVASLKGWTWSMCMDLQPTVVLPHIWVSVPIWHLHRVGRCPGLPGTFPVLILVSRRTSTAPLFCHTFIQALSHFFSLSLINNMLHKAASHLRP